MEIDDMTHWQNFYNDASSEELDEIADILRKRLAKAGRFWEP